MRGTRGVALLLTLGVTAIVAANLGRGRSTEALQVELQPVESGAVLRTVQVRGQVRPRRVVEVAPRVGGIVAQCFVRQGDSVAAGAVLVQLEAAPYQAALREAQAAVRSQNAKIDLARAEVALARHQERTAAALHARGHVPERELWAAGTSLRVAEARLRGTAQELVHLHNRFERARRDLEACRVVAPCEGVVLWLASDLQDREITSRSWQAGTPLLVLASGSEVRLEAQVSEHDVVELQPGQPVEIRLDAMQHRTFRGELESIDSAQRRGWEDPDPADTPSTYPIRVRFIEAVRGLRPGLSASLRIEIARLEQALRVPLAALVVRDASQEKGATAADVSIWEQAGPDHDDMPPGALTGWPDPGFTSVGVYRLEGLRVRFVALQTGIQGDDAVAVRGDLQVGTRIVVGPYRVLRQLRSGHLVRAAEAPPGQLSQE